MAEAKNKLSVLVGNLTRIANSAKKIAEKFAEIDANGELKSKYIKQWETIIGLYGDYGTWKAKFDTSYNDIKTKVKELKKVQRQLKLEPENKDLIKQVALLSGEITKDIQNLEATAQALKNRCKELNDKFKALDAQVLADSQSVQTEGITPKQNGTQIQPQVTETQPQQQGESTAVVPVTPEREQTPEQEQQQSDEQSGTQIQPQTTETQPQQQNESTAVVPVTPEREQTSAQEQQQSDGQNEGSNPTPAPAPTTESSAGITDTTETPDTAQTPKEEQQPSQPQSQPVSDKAPATEGKKEDKKEEKPQEVKHAKLNIISLAFPTLIISTAFLIAGIWMPFMFVLFAISGVLTIASGTEKTIDYIEKKKKEPKDRSKQEHKEKSQKKEKISLKDRLFKRERKASRVATQEAQANPTPVHENSNPTSQDARTSGTEATGDTVERNPLGQTPEMGVPNPSSSSEATQQQAQWAEATTGSGNPTNASGATPTADETEEYVDPITAAFREAQNVEFTDHLRNRHNNNPTDERDDGPEMGF